MKRLIMFFVFIGTLVTNSGCKKCDGVQSNQDDLGLCWDSAHGWYEPCGYYAQNSCNFNQTELVYNGVAGVLFFTSILLNGQQGWYGNWYPYGYHSQNPLFYSSPYMYGNRNINVRWYY